MQRRHLLQSGVLAGAGVTLSRLELPAIEPIVRKGGARLRLSVAAYSFRKHFGWMKGREQKPAGRAIDMRQFIDLCAEYGCAGTELTSYFFQGGAKEAYYRELCRYAFLRGIEISGTAVGNNFALPEGRARDEQIAAVKGWIDRAAVLGAPHVRVFAGAAKGIDE
ncbi:MAG: TIM barrel protein, partial [Verrucomicrobiaceae bacterium]|nr:TIM barrel protein [Verrucomicrobiaceae bacterium]